MPDRRTSKWIACGTVMWLSVGGVVSPAPGSQGPGEPSEADQADRAGSAGAAGSDGMVAANASVAVRTRPTADSAARPVVEKTAAPATQPAGQGAGARAVVRRAGSRGSRHDQVDRRTDGGRAWYADGLIALAIVLGMIAAAALAVRKWFGKFRTAVGGGDENLQIVSRLALSPKQSVCLIRLGRQVVLLGVTPEQISALAVVDDPEAVRGLLASAGRSSGPGLGDRFARFFSHASSDYDALPDEAAAAEMPMATGGRHYRQARTELSGLLDKVRSRGRSSRERAANRDDGAADGVIAVA